MGDLITTLVLNWNRASLLRETLASYVATVEPPYALTVIDNASTDESRDVLAAFRAARPATRLVLLDRNEGGEALNRVLPELAHGLVHIAENDQLFLPGWAAHVRASFAAFPRLGQLSLHAPMPTDEEAWEVKPSRPILEAGKLLYEALGNVGTSSILPASVFAEGIRVHNLPPPAPGGFLFPADARLSADIVASGRFVAWSDRYYVRNLGHEVQEFTRARSYYEGNYTSKPWLGVAGWEQRMAEHAARPRPRRASPLLPGRALLPEYARGTTRGLANQLWSMTDGLSPPAELMELAYTLVRLHKPRETVLTRTVSRDLADLASRAAAANGFGRVASWPDTAPGTPSAIDLLVLDAGAPGMAEDWQRACVRLDPGALILAHGGPPPETPALAWLPLAVPRGAAVAIWREA